MSEKNSKKLSFYLVIIFIVAVTLILISTLSQFHLAPDEVISEEEEEQLVFNQTIQQSISELIEENEKLSKELEAARAHIQELESAIIADEKDKTDADRMTENEEFLKSAEENYKKGNTKEAKEALMNVNAQILDGEKLEIYNRLAKSLGI